MIEGPIQTFFIFRNINTHLQITVWRDVLCKEKKEIMHYKKYIEFVNLENYVVTEKSMD